MTRGEQKRLLYRLLSKLPNYGGKTRYIKPGISGRDVRHIIVGPVTQGAKKGE